MDELGGKVLYSSSLCNGDYSEMLSDSDTCCRYYDTCMIVDCFEWLEFMTILLRANFPDLQVGQDELQHMSVHCKHSRRNGGRSEWFARTTACPGSAWS